MSLKQLARLSELSTAFIEESNLRVHPARFEKGSLRGERTTLGRYDTRLEGHDADAAGDRPGYDPSYASVQGAFTATFNEYIRTQLKYESDLTYEVLTDKGESLELQGI